MSAEMVILTAADPARRWYQIYRRQPMVHHLTADLDRPVFYPVTTGTDGHDFVVMDTIGELIRWPDAASKMSQGMVISVHAGRHRPQCDKPTHVRPDGATYTLLALALMIIAGAGLAGLGLLWLAIGKGPSYVMAWFAGVIIWFTWRHWRKARRTAPDQEPTDG